MKYYLYTFKVELAHDLDASGFSLLTEDEKGFVITKIKKEFKNGGDLSFANQTVQFDTLQELMDCIDLKEITQAQYKSIKRAFGKTSFGELGPLDSEDFKDEEYCEECGNVLDNDYGAVCSDCEEAEDEGCTCDNCGEELNEDDECPDCDEDDESEWEYESHAKIISDFIIAEYGLEVNTELGAFANFNWKPTPNTEIQIKIDSFDIGTENIAIRLKLKNSLKQSDFFKVEDIYLNPAAHLKPIVDKFIKLAQNY